MAIVNLYKSFIWYYKKHGLQRLTQLGLRKIWRRINNKEIMLVFDLESMPLECKLQYLPNVFVQSYEVSESIPKADKDQLIRLKSKEILDSHLHHFFKKGATLWIAKIDQQIVGLCWTLIGGFDGFYSMPMTSRDAIYLAAEVFPEFRGQGIASALRLLIYSQLRQHGVARVFVKSHVANVSSLRSVAKTNNQRIGIVRTFRIFGKHITIWN